MTPLPIEPNGNARPAVQAPRRVTQSQKADDRRRDGTKSFDPAPFGFGIVDQPTEGHGGPGIADDDRGVRPHPPALTPTLDTDCNSSLDSDPRHGGLGEYHPACALDATARPLDQNTAPAPRSERAVAEVHPNGRMHGQRGVLRRKPRIAPAGSQHPLEPRIGHLRFEPSLDASVGKAFVERVEAVGHPRGRRR